MADKELMRFLYVGERAFKAWESVAKRGLLMPTWISDEYLFTLRMWAIRFSQLCVAQQVGNAGIAMFDSTLPREFSNHDSISSTRFSCLVFDARVNMFTIMFDSVGIAAKFGKKSAEYVISALVLKHTGTIVLHAEKLVKGGKLVPFLSLTPQQEKEAWWFFHMIRGLSSGTAAYRRQDQSGGDVAWSL